MLTPAAVATEIYTSSAAYRENTGVGGPNPFADTPAEIAAGMNPDELGRRVLDGISAGQFYLITHPDTRGWIESRHARIMAAYDFADRWEAEHKK